MGAVTIGKYERDVLWQAMLDQIEAAEFNFFEAPESLEPWREDVERLGACFALAEDLGYERDDPRAEFEITHLDELGRVVEEIDESARDTLSDNSEVLVRMSDREMSGDEFSRDEAEGRQGDDLDLQRRFVCQRIRAALEGERVPA